MHPRELAYLGDAVYELHVRQSLLGASLSQRARHRAVVARVRADAQAETLRVLEDQLEEDERDVLRRARNVKGPVPRGVDQVTYRQATAFEALIGYRYLTGPLQRLGELLTLADQVATPPARAPSQVRGTEGGPIEHAATIPGGASSQGRIYGPRSAQSH